MTNLASSRRCDVLDELRAKIAGLERSRRGGERRVLPFGAAQIDARMPQGGLALGALHEVAAGGSELTHAAAAGLFAARVLARMNGPVLWCLRGRRGVFAPGLAGAGLSHDRVIYAEAENGDAGVLAILEEGLAHSSLAGVVGEVKRLSMTAARRLQLAAEKSGVTAFVLRPFSAEAVDEPTAAITRWRLTALPSSALPVAGVGRPRWRVELIRCRSGQPAQWIVEACDAKSHLDIPADVADGQTSADAPQSVAAQ